MMNEAQVLLESEIAGQRVIRAVVDHVDESGLIHVRGAQGGSLACEVLITTKQALPRFERGDSVLVWHTGNEAEPGVVLGRIGLALATEEEREEPPDQVVIEAKQRLTLKCADSSVTLRNDGKILVKGRDVVSHAARMNRIKGGAVAIN